MTRARVTQVLGLLELPPEIVEALGAVSDPLPKPMVTEPGLRLLLGLPAKARKLVHEGTSTSGVAG